MVSSSYHGRRDEKVLGAVMVVSFSAALYLALEIIRTGESFAIPDLQSGLSLVALGLMAMRALH